MRIETLEGYRGIDLFVQKLSTKGDVNLGNGLRDEYECRTRTLMLERKTIVFPVVLLILVLMLYAISAVMKCQKLQPAVATAFPMHTRMLDQVVQQQDVGYSHIHALQEQR